MRDFESMIGLESVKPGARVSDLVSRAHEMFNARLFKPSILENLETVDQRDDDDDEDEELIRPVAPPRVVRPDDQAQRDMFDEEEEGEEEEEEEAEKGIDEPIVEYPEAKRHKGSDDDDD